MNCRHWFIDFNKNMTVTSVNACNDEKIVSPTYLSSHTHSMLLQQYNIKYESCTDNPLNTVGLGVIATEIIHHGVQIRISKTRINARHLAQDWYV
jgi:hypothetical protein